MRSLLFFVLLAVFFLPSNNYVEAAGPTQFSPGVVKKQSTAPVVEVESEDVDESAAEISERTGTVDAVRKDKLIIDDSAVWFTESVLFYDRYGKRTSKDAFKVGNRVLITTSEDRDGTRTLVSLSLVKSGKGAEEDVNKRNHPEEQKIKKVNGVWVN